MGGDEVLQNGETLAEVCSDRVLNDLTRGLGHEASHTSELTNLRLRATRTRVDHHVDGVEGGLLS